MSIRVVLIFKFKNVGAGITHFFKCYEKIICGEFSYNELPPSRATRGMKNDQRR
jgi:hypothetical protein